MRRSIIAARSSAGSLARAAVYQQHLQPRRMFASGSGTPPSKSEPPTTPVDRSEDQAQPIGAYYEGVLQGSKNYPDTKPELPPVTSQKYPTKLAPAEPQAKPELEKKQSAGSEPKPKQDDSAQGTSSQSAQDPTPSSNPSGDLSGSDGSGTVPEASSSPSPQILEDGEAGNTRIIFSASLTSEARRAERLASIRSQSKLIAGVLVPPRPEEPENCCMSGCINCVWDMYRDEMEAWATATAEAEQRLAAQQAGLGEEGVVAATGAVEAGGSRQTPSTSTSTAAGDGQEQQTIVKGTELTGTAHSVVDQRGAVSMDDDGGGSSSNWDFGTAQSPATGTAGTTKTLTSTWDDNLYKNVPVGIREFMKQEKRLKEKHAREGTVG
ncbi:oxidoreductase-like protein [Neurospora crassa]|nr:oxidoreductase-like protein [Neurospora crassa]